MGTQAVTEALRQALMTAFCLSLPLLAVGFVTGIAVSILQILTSIQDPSFGAVPRLTAYLAGILIFLPWMLGKIMSYAASVFGDLSPYAK